jgi:hypothetical protein
LALECVSFSFSAFSFLFFFSVFFLEMDTIVNRMDLTPFS